MTAHLRLFTYWRSSAAYRVRIGLNLKGLAWDAVPVNLVRDGGEHKKAQYRALNPQGLVPALQHEGGVVTQSIAILEFLDEVHPQPPLLPGDALARSRIRALSLAVACDVHPLNNLRVLRYLKEVAGLGKDASDQWYRHWIAEGFSAVESELQGSTHTGDFCHGDTPTMADCCLVPQVYNANRFECDMTPYPEIRRINAACLELDAFQRAEPAAQPDAD